MFGDSVNIYLSVVSGIRNPNVDFSKISKTFIICVSGGVLATILQIPLPWMIGPMLAMVVGKLTGINLDVPKGGRQFGQIVIGSALGLYFTPAVAREVLTYGPLMVLAAIASILLGCGSGLVMTRLTGIDRTTAFFSSIPASAVEMMVLGERFGAAVDRVVLAQSLRLMLVVLIEPAVLHFFGAHGNYLFHAAQTNVNLIGLLLLFMLTMVGGLVLQRFAVPNAWMMGPLIISIALTVSEINLSAMPIILTYFGQFLIGSTLGSRFDRKFLAYAPRDVVGTVVSILLAVTASWLLGTLLAVFSGIPVTTMLLASAPGGVAEMCITAKVLGLAVPLVTAFHVTRVLLLVSGTAPLYRLLQRIQQRSEA
jgi:membrane AbrB-like protein